MSTFKPSPALVQAQERTLARLAKIAHQFNTAKGSNRLENKVAILTGCGSLKGIGRATAVLFAREGAFVVDAVVRAGRRPMLMPSPFRFHFFLSRCEAYLRLGLQRRLAA